MPRLGALALLGATLALPATGQGLWGHPTPDCAFPPPAWSGPGWAPLATPSPWAPSPWSPRHEPWVAPQWTPHWSRSAPPLAVTRRERLSEHDARAWYGEPRQAWHAEDDRRHGRWRGAGLFD